MTSKMVAGHSEMDGRLRLSSPALFQRALLAITTVLLAYSAYLVIQEIGEQGILFASRRWTAFAGVLALAALLGLAAFAASWTVQWPRIEAWVSRLTHLLARAGLANLALAATPVLVYSYLILGAPGRLLQGFAIRAALFWLAVLFGSIFIAAYSISRGSGLTWMASLAATWLIYGFFYKVTTFIPDLSTYPFSLGWSEASRYYYASLFFGGQIYGVHTALPVLHPTRYMLQAIPFLVPGTPLWFHRLWQVFLWVGMAAIVGILLARRLAPEGRWNFHSALFTAWVFLFLFQGPVYYHLLVMPALVLWGFDGKHFWKSTTVLLVASVWAGISRINWFPVPGMLAAMLYFLEVRIADRGEFSFKNLAKYLLRPVAWVVAGTAVAFAAQSLYIPMTGTSREAFTSSFTSDLLWYRLLPNATYPMGVLPAILLVSVPLLYILIFGLRGLHPIRSLGIAAILLLLFLGGVVVSVKIGGGSNLHNLDAYLTLLLVAAGYVYFGHVTQDKHILEGVFNPSRWVLSGVLLLPVMFAVSTGSPRSLPDQARTDKALASLEDLVYTAAGQGGEVLFITERQLLTFHTVQNVPLVEDYETVYLMEMAMSGNTSYLDRFNTDLQDHRFALIITDQVNENLKGRDYSFGEENDVWARRVATPLLDYYQREDSFKGLGIEVLGPRQ